MGLRQRTRTAAAPSRCRVSTLLAALVLASAVLRPSAALDTVVTVAPSPSVSTSNSSSSSAEVCAAPKCKIAAGGTCDRSVAGCPVCLQFVAASSSFACTTVVKTTNACPTGFQLCSSVFATLTVTPTPSPTPSSSVAPAAKANPNATNSSAAPNADKLTTASAVETPAPATATTTSTTSSHSSVPAWLVIAACTVVGCVLAAVLGTVYASRQQRKQHAATNSSATTNNEPKDVDATIRGVRATTITEFTDSVVDLSATPSTSTSMFAYASTGLQSTRSSAADSAVQLKSDAWRLTTTSHHSFRGSQHVNMSCIDDDPLTASQLTTDGAARSARSARSARESDDVFGHPSSVQSEWRIYTGNAGARVVDNDNDGDDRGSANSGGTEFYSSKISAITSIADDSDDDDDARRFTYRSSERRTDDSAAEWKQKFYVEL